MKSTGVVRHIDKLGRIVIPKEIRKILKIRDNDNLEIFINNESIILKKYSLFNNFKDIIDNLSNILYDVTKKNIIITDLLQVISCNAKLENQYLFKNISSNYFNFLNGRKKIISNNLSYLNIINNKKEKINYFFNPIIINGELIGSIIIFSNNEKIESEDMYLLTFVMKYLEKNIED